MCEFVFIWKEITFYECYITFFLHPATPIQLFTYACRSTFIAHGFTFVGEISRTLLANKSRCNRLFFAFSSISLSLFFALYFTFCSHFLGLSFKSLFKLCFSSIKFTQATQTHTQTHNASVRIEFLAHIYTMFCLAKLL